MISWTRCALGQTQEAGEPASTGVPASGSSSQATSVQDPPAATIGLNPASAAGGAKAQQPAPDWSPRPRRADPGFRASSLIPWVLLTILFGMVFHVHKRFTQEHRLREGVEQQLQLAQQDIARLLEHNDQLAEHLQTLKLERDTLEERVFSLGVQLSSMTSELERAKSRLAEAQHIATQLADTQAKLQEQLASARDAKEESVRQLERLHQEKAELRRAASRLRQRLALVERDYRGVAAQLAQSVATPHPGVHVVSSIGSAGAPAPRSAAERSVALTPESVMLPPVIVRNDPRGAAMPVRGRLVDINGTHRFVIIDKGLLHGVREGMRFTLFHDDVPVGQAQVVRVRPQLAACHLLDPATTQRLREGDAAVQQAP